MKLKAVFFDLDGTLLDTAVDLGNALNKLLIEFGKKPIPNKSLRDHVSNGAAALLKIGFGVTPDDDPYDRLREKLLQYYLADLASNTAPFDGIEQLIRKLHEHNIDWGIVTNKPWTYADPLMKYFSFARAPLCLICPEHVKEKKPAPEALLLACEQANCKTSEAIYIGDHLRDIQCGKNAGMPTIAAAYGYIVEGDDHRSWQATHTAKHASDIWPQLETYL